MWYETLLEKNLLPDSLIRFGIKNMLSNKLKIEGAGDEQIQNEKTANLVTTLKESPIAIHTTDANEQHYEVPSEFYQYCLGHRMKYSCALWPENIHTLDAAEESMLDLYAERAEIKDGDTILDLGCGWGSLSLYLAEKFPNSKILGVSNSNTQRAYINEQSALRKLKNLTIQTQDINEFEANQTFDKILSIEMFEHMRNYEKLFEKISRWMHNESSLFVHIFAHKQYAYPYEIEDQGSWMARYFFSGGMMPSESLFSYFDKHLTIAQQWRVNGIHYKKTCEAWLSKMDSSKKRIMEIFKNTYGKDQALKWWVYWRVFYMSCAELFGYKNGEEWFVSHYLFKKTR